MITKDLLVIRVTLVMGLLFSASLLMAENAEESSISLSNSDSDWTMPRTEYGKPNLQGEWWFGSRTPFQRRSVLGEQKVFSIDQVKAIESDMLQRNIDLAEPLDPNRRAPEVGSVIRQEADDNFLSHYQEPELVAINGQYLTSVVTSPSNGRINRNDNFQDFYAQRKATGLSATDGPEGQPLSGRCLSFGSALPSLTPIMMNPNIQIVQTRDHVMIMAEMVHDARIVKLDSDHPNNGIKKWMGDSVGYWEGDTLVVYSQNFRPEQSSMRSFPMSDRFEVVERYTLLSDNEIHFAFEVKDPLSLIEPVSGERLLTRNSPADRIYEFACHEGNYSLANILRGARQQELDQRGVSDK